MLLCIVLFLEMAGHDAHMTFKDTRELLRRTKATLEANLLDGQLAILHELDRAVHAKLVQVFERCDVQRIYE